MSMADGVDGHLFSTVHTEYMYPSRNLYFFWVFWGHSPCSAEVYLRARRTPFIRDSLWRGVVCGLHIRFLEAFSLKVSLNSFCFSARVNIAEIIPDDIDIKLSSLLERVNQREICLFCFTFLLFSFVVFIFVHLFLYLYLDRGE